jgi:hypothetical protein
MKFIHCADVHLDTPLHYIQLWRGDANLLRESLARMKKLNFELGTNTVNRATQNHTVSVAYDGRPAGWTDGKPRTSREAKRGR